MDNRKIKNKIIKHLIFNGNKETCEKIFLKTIKELQKLSKKKPEKWIKLAIIFTTSIFKMHKITNKKRKYIRETPFAIVHKQARISLAIKYFLAEIKEEKITKNFYVRLAKVWITNTNNESLTIQLKNKLQKQVLLKRRVFLYYYRWK